MMANYILVDKEPILETDITKWCQWFEKGNRVLQKTKVGEAEVSTVFLGIDHRFGGGGAPVLFETMVFGGALDGQMGRYTSWDEATAGHTEMCDRVENL